MDVYGRCIELVYGCLWLSCSSLQRKQGSAAVHRHAIGSMVVAAPMSDSYQELRCNQQQWLIMVNSGLIVVNSGLIVVNNGMIIVGSFLEMIPIHIENSLW